MAATPGAARIGDVPEDIADGAIGTIYAEIRTTYAAPYVSSIHRLLAAEPGVLAWAWALLRPAFISGAIPETAWRLASGLNLTPAAPLSPAALSLMGVDSRATETIRAICDTFIRVSPVNLLFGGCLRRVLDGSAKPAGKARAPIAAWTPPPALAPVPALRDFETLSADEHAVLMQLATTLQGKSFIPGLYRMLAHWPGYLAHAATVLGPVFADPAIARLCTALRDRVDAAADNILADLPPAPAGFPAPDAKAAVRLAEAIETYRQTSPQMVVFGTLLSSALPAPTTEGGR